MPKPAANPDGGPSTVSLLSHKIWLEENGTDKIKLLNNPIIKAFGVKPGLLKKLKKVEADLSDEYKLLKFEFINCGIVTLKE